MATTRTHFRVQASGVSMDRLYDIVNNGLVMGVAEFLAMILILALLSYWS